MSSEDQLVTLRVMLRQLGVERDALRENNRQLINSYTQARAAYQRARDRADLGDAISTLADGIGRELAATAILGRLYAVGDITAARAVELADEFGVSSSLRPDLWPGPPPQTIGSDPATGPVRPARPARSVRSAQSARPARVTTVYARPAGVQPPSGARSASVFTRGRPAPSAQPGYRYGLIRCGPSPPAPPAILAPLAPPAILAPPALLEPPALLVTHADRK